MPQSRDPKEPGTALIEPFSIKGSTKPIIRFYYISFNLSLEENFVSPNNREPILKTKSDYMYSLI